MGDVFTTCFILKGSYSGNTYIKIIEKSYLVISGLYVNEISLLQLISFILKGNWSVCRCHFYCKFWGKWV